MHRIIGILRVITITFGLEILVLLLLITGPALLANEDATYSGFESVVWLPHVRYQPPPTPPPTPEPPPVTYAARLQITPTGGINASTFNTGSFILSNDAANDQAIVTVRLDLRTAVFPDMVFDPYGLGGDTLAKDLEVDSAGGTGFSGHQFAGEHGGGYDVLILDFADFDPGETFVFSLDVDPNSIRGVSAPGPNEAGSVSGLELTGSRVSVTFADGTELSSQLFAMPGSLSGAQSILRPGLSAAPQLSIVGIDSTPADVTKAAQTAIITGPAWQPGTLLVLEGGLFLEGVPKGGYDVQPYDTNSLIAVWELPAGTTHAGQVFVPVTLTKSMAGAGINHLVAAFDDHYGAKGPLSNQVTLQFQP